MGLGKTPFRKRHPAICWGGLGVAIVLGVILLAALASTPVKVQKTPETISQFVALTEGDRLTLRFSLVDSDRYAVCAPGEVELSIQDDPFGGVPKEVYFKRFTVTCDDFKFYQLVLTGQPILAYSWFVPFADVRNPASDFGKASLTFATGSKTLKASENLVRLKL